MDKQNIGCSVDGCVRPHKGHGFCRMHLERFKTTGSTADPVKSSCSVDGCGRKHYGIGFCLMHWKRFKKTGSTDGVQPRECTVCKETFTPHEKQPHALRCSMDCQNVFQYAKRKSAEPSKACKSCGTLFTPLEKTTEFCSHKCGSPQAIANRTVDLCCADCGVTFTSKVQSGKHVTCKACSKERMLVRVRARNKVRRYLRRGAAGPTHTKSDWDALVARHNGLCAYCGKNPAEHRDHVMPISRGGGDSIGNILPACSPCNLEKGDKLLSEWKWKRKNGRKKTIANPIANSPGEPRQAQDQQDRAEAKARDSVMSGALV